MSLYRTSSRAKITYYSYASRVVTGRLSRAVGAIAWCVLVVSGTLRHFASRSYSEWLVWPTLSSFAVLLFVTAWRWNQRRRTRARAGFRESSPD